MFEWLVIGGGLHGVHIAARLVGEAGVDPSALRIIDPNPELLARWRECTARTGMSFLRSPCMHHLDIEPLSLLQYAEETEDDDFTPPYRRPALRLFDRHCDGVIQRYGLAALHVQAYVQTCEVGCDGVRVGLAGGKDVRARRVVLAMGAGDTPEIPSWAPRAHPRVQHVFAPSFDAWPHSPESVAVVGGGITAGQIALRLVGEGHRVALIRRHPIREEQFDSDPGWLGPKFVSGFEEERSPSRRREMITAARHRGSVPPEIRIALDEAIEAGSLTLHEHAVSKLDAPSLDALRLDIHRKAMHLYLADGSSLRVDRVLLATGFVRGRPGGTLVDQLASSAELPCGDCGYPVVDRLLRWHPRVHVAGPLAELELGPAARNIAGARRAGDRLVDTARSTLPI